MKVTSTAALHEIMLFAGAKMDYFYVVTAYCLSNLLLSILMVRYFPRAATSIRIRKNLLTIFIFPVVFIYDSLVKLIRLSGHFVVRAFEFLSGQKIYRRSYAYSSYNYGTSISRRTQNRDIVTEAASDNTPDEIILADEAKSGAK